MVLCAYIQERMRACVCVCVCMGVYISCICVCVFSVRVCMASIVYVTF